jgi:ABC-type transport system substrate-binding protein
MLEAAGVKDLSMKIWAMPVSRPYMLNARRAAELMQADLAKVGVKVEIVTHEWAEYLKLSKDVEARWRRDPRLDRRQWRSGQLPRHAAWLRSRWRQ